MIDPELADGLDARVEVVGFQPHPVPLAGENLETDRVHAIAAHEPAYFPWLG